MSEAIERGQPLVVQVSKPFELVVNHDCPFSEQLERCRYGWINRNVRAGYFVSEGKGVVRYQAKYLSVGCQVRDFQIERIVRCEDAHRPWRLAALVHVLADAAIENETNAARPIAALGSVARIHNDDYYAYSYLGGEKRIVGIQQTTLRWLEGACFLIVRPVV